MYPHIEILMNRATGNSITAIMRFLEPADLPALLGLQDCITQQLADKNLYRVASSDEFAHRLMPANGVVLGCFVEGSLIASLVLATPNLQPINLGYDLGFSQELLPEVAQLEWAQVHPDYRGNRLQQSLSVHLENFAREKKYRYLCLTVSPDNMHSLQNCLKLGFEIKADKLKYGGLRRYVMCKSIFME